MCNSLHYKVLLDDKFTNDSIYDTLLEIAPILNDTVFQLVWEGDVINKFNRLTPTLTDDDLCFAFNGLNSRDIYTEE